MTIELGESTENVIADSEPEPSSEATVVVYDPVSQRVLAGPDGRCALTAAFESKFPPMDYQLVAQVTAQTGLDCAVLDALDFYTGVVETVSTAGAVPPGFEWRPRAAATEVNEVCADWVTTADSRIQPWFRPGWYTSACQFVAEIAGRHGRTPLGPADQVKHWSMSSVLRQSTDGGDLYLKGTLPQLAHEPDVIALLAERWPGSVPTVLARRPDDQIWIAEDFGGTAGMDLPSDDAAACLSRVVEIQDSLTGEVDTLRALGCIDLTMPVLGERLPELFAHPIWSEPDSWRNRDQALDPEEQACFRGLLPALVDRCGQLHQLAIPDTMIHGDLQRGNIVRTKADYLIFDWSFASIGNPVFDLASWIFDADEDDAREQISFYLTEWQRRRPHLDYERVWALAKPLSAVAEIMKFVWLADLVGPAHDFNWLGIAYGWARRLMNAMADTDDQIATWRK